MEGPLVLQIKTEPRLSDEKTERLLREELAAAFRLAVHFDLHEGIDNHFSVVVPGPEERYLINPEGFHWSELTPDTLLLCDGEGNILKGEGEVEATALHIHVATHRLRPDAQCILHTHMPYATALTCIEGGELRFCQQNALRFHGRVGYDRRYGGVALDGDEGRNIASGIGDADIVFLAHHGVMILGASIAEAFDDLYFLERSCKVQAIAASMGTIRDVDPDVARHTARQMDALRARSSDLLFTALRRTVLGEDGRS